MSHTAELIAVGTELLLGNIANTDAQMLSQGLSALGINVYYHTVVGDNPQRLRAAVELAKSRADILITTGGLGPTCDDLTKNVLAECFGKKLVFHAPSARRIEAYFERLHAGRPMTENNYQQAMLPEGCTVLDNDWGTAPGVAFEADGVREGDASGTDLAPQHALAGLVRAVLHVGKEFDLRMFAVGNLRAHPRFDEAYVARERQVDIVGDAA